jgi:hypothetical protein
MVTSPNRSRTRRTSRRSEKTRGVGYILMWTVRAVRLCVLSPRKRWTARDIMGSSIARLIGRVVIVGSLCVMVEFDGKKFCDVEREV